MTRPDQQDHPLFAPRWWASIREAALVILVAAAAAVFAWAVQSDRLPLVADRDFYELEAPAPLVDIPQALILFEEGDHIFIDTRPDGPEERDTIPGAFRIRAVTFDEDLYELTDIIYPEEPVILFGDGDLRGTAFVADLLLAREFENILILRGTVEAWREQGGEISSRATGHSSDGGEGS